MSLSNEDAGASTAAFQRWSVGTIIKKAGQDTRDFENENDTLVYALYGLSDEEVAIVEGNDTVIKSQAEKIH